MTFITALSDGRFAAHNSYHGPFNPSGTTKYIPLLNSTLRTLGMAKATLSSPGDGDWSQVGADIAISGSSDVVCLWAVHDPGNTRICVATGQANGTFRYHQFSTGSETWTISDEVIVTPTASTAYTAAEALPMLAISWRADGDVTCVHNGNNGTNNGLNRTVRTSSWSTTTRILNSTASITGIASAVEGATDSGVNDERTNFLVARGTSDVRRWHFNDGITIDNEEATTGLDSAAVLTGAGCMDSSDDVYFPFVDSDDYIHVTYWDGTDDASAVTPTVTSAISNNTVAYNGSSTKPFPPMCLVYDGTDVHLIYSADSDDDIRWNDDAISGGTETTVVSGITCHHLSAGISSDNNSILLIYGNGNAVPVFTKVTITASATPVNFPLSAFLYGLRSLPLIPDEPPGTTLTLPPVEGTTIWEQLWGQCVLAPLNISGATWDADNRGAIGFTDSTDEICIAPGKLRVNNWPSGTYETVFDEELNANAVRIISTRTQYETPSSQDPQRNHTDFEFHSDVQGWARGGRAWPALQEYKFSFLVKLGMDFSISNPQWTIVSQAFGFGDANDGSRNPWMPISILNGRWQISCRGDSRDPLNGDKEYEYPNQVSGEPLTRDLGAVVVDTWELFEVWFNYDYRRTGAVGTGNGYCIVHRNEVQRLNLTGIQLGFNDADGSYMGMGIYHNFNGTSLADVNHNSGLQIEYGGVRFERL